jgi:hypothetical protein
MFNEQRKSALLFIAEKLANGSCSTDFVNVIKSYEPYVPWQRVYLERRARCYRERDPMAAKAERDLESSGAASRSLDELTAPAPSTIDLSPPKSP